MSDTTFLVALIAVALLAALVGGTVTYIRMHRRLADLRERNASLTATLDMERAATAEKLDAVEKARQQLTETFTSLSTQALKHNSEEFLRLARENLKQFHVQAQGDLDKKEKSIETLVKPIKEALDKTEKEIRRMENERKQAYGSLTKHLETMAQTQQLLQNETRNLVQALRRPEVRGQWGELTLKRLAEIAGMVEHCDFFEQQYVSSEDGALRPDMVVRMPDEREIVVDAKTSLDAYLAAAEAPDDASRQAQLERHARKMRERVKELSSKAYWSRFEHAPDFVVMFIPGEQFLSTALEKDRDLLEDALRSKVILATPTSFVALLRAVAYGWRQEALAANADAIRKLGEELYGRLATFSEYLAKLGSSLNSSIANYNKAIGSYDARVLPSARKFVEMGVSSKKDVEQIEQVEKIAKEVAPDPDKKYQH